MSKSVHVKIPEHKSFLSEESILSAKNAIPEKTAYDTIQIYDGEIARALTFLANTKKPKFEHHNCQYEIRKLAEALLSMAYKIEEYDKKIEFLIEGINLADEELEAELRVAQARHRAFERAFVHVEDARRARKRWKQDGVKRGYQV